MTRWMRLMAWLAAAPPAVVAVVFAVSGAAALVTQQPLIWRAPDVSLSQAVWMRDESEAVRLMTLGADPNRRYQVIDEVRQDTYDLTPLEAAIATRRVYMVHLVIDGGARITPENAPVIGCFARRMDVPALEQYLAERGARAGDCSRVPLPID